MLEGLPPQATLTPKRTVYSLHSTFLLINLKVLYVIILIYFTHYNSVLYI